MKKKNQRIAELNISKSRFFIGIFLGLSYAFVFYSFLYLTREVIRVFTITEEYDLWILTDEEVNVSNLFFAFISVIMGQSICFVFWIDKPNQVFQKTKVRCFKIIHEQRFFNWFFLSWFSRIVFLCALVGYDAINDGYFTGVFPIDGKYLFILVVLVLFLQTWNSIRISFGQKSLRLMFVSAIIITVVSFVFSKVNLIDYKEFNKAVLSQNIEYKYNLVVPESGSYMKLKHKSLISRFYVVEDAVTKRVIIVRNKKEISFKEISREMSSFSSHISEFEIPYVTYQLHIHKEMKMKYVNPLIREFSKYGSRIGFAVAPVGYEGKRNIRDNSLVKRYSQYSKEYDNERNQKILEGIRNKITIELRENGSRIVNNLLIEDDKEIIEILKKEIRENSDNYIIMYYLNLDVVFSSYIDVISLFRVAAFEVRNTYSLNKYLTGLESLHREQRNEVFNKFPLMVYEQFKYSD